jgi:two-component system, response regulator PdtaR
LNNQGARKIAKGNGVAGVRLIIAEDQLLVALDMETIVTNAGHEVCGIAANADEALTLVAEHRPDLALLDVELGGTDGLEAARLIMDRWQVPTLLVTGHVSMEIARDVGVVGLVRKPFTERTLLSTIDACLDWLNHGVVQQPAPPGFIGPDIAGPEDDSHQPPPFRRTEG